VHEGKFQRLISIFKFAFDSLGVQIGLGDIEDLTILIHKGMAEQSRNYHNLDHVFSLVDDSSPIITLAALFHDLVYCQVDMGFLPEIHQVIDPYVQENDGKMQIIKDANEDDRLFRLVLDIFDFNPGRSLGPTDGLNEFLSALVMLKKLERLLSENDLFKLILCVEASIPFRESAITGLDYFYTLEKRALLANERAGLGLTEDDIQDAVKIAVRFANRDVGSFAETDVACYLETTWKLLPELNASLRSIEVYSIREYRKALQIMESSMLRLNPEKVFHQYRGVPSDTDYQKMVRQAKLNVHTGQEFLRIKLLTQAILEALAEETGGDAPLSLFLGDPAQEHAHWNRLEDFLPDKISPVWMDTTTDVYQLLIGSGNCTNNFDLGTSPLSLFVYKCISPFNADEILEQAREMFDDRITALEFLQCLDPGVLASIASATAEMVLTRREQLLQFASN
jgi:hypothetical protein